MSKTAASRGAGLPVLLCLALLSPACQQGTESATETTTADKAAAAPPETQGAADEVELEYWRTVKDSEHSDDLWSYLDRYPNGAFVDLAKAKLERLMREGGDKDSAAPKGAAAATAKTPPPPTATGGSVRQTREQIVKSAIRRASGKYSDARFHVAPNIPRFKLDNVAQVHNLDTSRVLMLYDDGFSGGGKTGFCLTDRKVYWRFVSGSPAYFLDFEDVSEVRVRKKKFFINGYDVGVTMAANPPRAAEVFADLLEEIRNQLRR